MKQDKEVGVESNINSDAAIASGDTSDQSQDLEGFPPADKSPDHDPADHLTWNGTSVTSHANISLNSY